MTEELLSRHADLFNIVQAWDNGELIDRYVVAIGDLIWYMSDSPDKICECGGDWLENW